MGPQPGLTELLEDAVGWNKVAGMMALGHEISGIEKCSEMFILSLPHVSP